MLLLAFAPLITLFLLLTYYSESLTVCSFGESRERKSPPSSELSNSSKSRSYLESFFSRKIPPEYLSLILVEQKSREHLKIHSSCEAWNAAVVPIWHPSDLRSLLGIPTLSPTYTLTLQQNQSQRLASAPSPPSLTSISQSFSGAGETAGI